MSSINFNNGFYEFSTNTFNKYDTDKKPDMSVNYDYIEYTGDEPIFKEIDEYFNKLLKNEDERNRLLKLLSNRIRGIEDYKFNIIYGPASNGKSVFSLLVKKLFGDYSQSMNVDFIDELKLNVEDLCKKRFLIISEPTIETFSNLNKTLFDKLPKQLDVYRNKNNSIPKIQLLIISNYLPNLSNYPEQDKSKLNILHFNTSFIDKKKEITKENQEYADFSYDQKIKTPEWNSALIWLLIHKY